MSPTPVSPSYVNQRPRQRAPRPPPLSLPFPLLPQNPKERGDRSIESNSTMKRSTSLGIVAASMALVLLFTMKVQHKHLMMESRDRPFDGSVQRVLPDEELAGLPRGIVAATSDMEMKPLWQSGRSEANVPDPNCTTLLAVAVGIMQKPNVDVMVRKFLSENFSVILFHYDGNVDGWHDLEWSFKAIHICAQNQTKWWFAKRFLHPDVVSFYDYIFLWDEDLGVENFHPRRYLQIVVSEGLQISQPALDPDSTDIHHRITLRNSKGKVHRRIYGSRGRLNCSHDSSGPPCTGWVEGMVPVFSRAAWRCVWHLIQNDLIHGWGLDMKLGYCAQIHESPMAVKLIIPGEKGGRGERIRSQGDRTKNVGVVDSEFVMHKGIPSLGGPSAPKAPSARTLDLRTHIRRQSTAELEKFKQRWDQAAREDPHWADPFQHFQRRRKACSWHS